MRVRQVRSGLTANAVAGCHVVLLGFDADPRRRHGLRGFAVRRTDPTEGETYWMKGTKTFRSVEPSPGAGEQFSSLIHPFQTFQWADYSAKPDRDYTYEVVPMYGDPGSLRQGDPVEVTVHTEPVEAVDHTVLFNRGSVATQEYARRFQNKKPSDIGAAAYRWLSRGLLEGILGFIGRAKDETWGLKGAFYEFQWLEVLDALGAARRRKAEVEIVFDDIDGGGPHEENETAIEEARIKGICVPRANGRLMHNKFLVLTHRGKPRSLLFGSTNITENGIFGHANCVHIIEDAEVAQAYLDYFEQLRRDPPTDRAHPDYRGWTTDRTPAPVDLPKGGMAPVFSPRADLATLDWYAEMASGARHGVFMTFAFGMNERFRRVYSRDDDVLRMGLMEKEWNGRNKEVQIAAIRELQARPNVVIAVGNRIPLSGLDQWLGEIDRLKREVNVRWIHTKFMLVDPLSDDPVVVTGSANFSESSTDTNDENMLVIRGNRRVADIYFGEFFRLHSHYAFRQAVGIFLQQNPNRTVEDFASRYLVEGRDWTADYFTPGDGGARYLRRLYFAGEP
jgi:phosphatidylserine/phosphatidylglycerophosphate/cardiolipin synthase-like enzyme